MRPTLPRPGAILGIIPGMDVGGGALSVYLDLVIALNFLVDFLLFLGVNRLSGFPSGWKRAGLASALGALYSGICLLPGFHFLMNTLWRLVFLALMSVLAFGWNRSTVKRGGLFLLLTMAMGGAAMGFGEGNFFLLILAAGGITLLCRIGFGNRVLGQEYVALRICHEQRWVSLIALRDSGNTLSDPITGEQVLVVGADVAQKLLGLTPTQLQAPLETLAQRPVPGLRLIPYHSVGRSGGMLLAARFPQVYIGSKRIGALIAFAPEVVGEGDCYQALAGGAFV